MKGKFICIAAALSVFFVLCTAAQELVVETGHRSMIRDMALSNDGKLLATLGDDDTIILRDTKSGKKLRELPVKSPVSHLEFLSDGRTLLAGGYNNIILVSKFGTVYRENGGLANAVSPDGGLLAVAFENTIKLKKIPGPEIRTFSQRVSDLTFTPDGKMLVTAGEDGIIRFWDIETGTEIRKLAGHTESVYSIEFLSDGKTLASVGRDRNVKLWDAETGRELHSLNDKDFVFRIPQSDSAKVFFLPDRKTFISISLQPDLTSRKMKLNNIQTKQEIWSLTLDKEVGRFLMISPDGKKFVTRNDDETTIMLWDAATGKELRRFPIFGTEQERRSKILNGRSNAVIFSPDSKTLISGSSNIKFWDVESGQLLRSAADQNSDVITAHALSPDNRVLALGGMNGLKLVNLQTGIEIFKTEDPATPIYHMTFSADGKILATGDGDNNVRLWDASTGRKVHSLSLKDRPKALALSPDGKTLAASILQGEEIYLFDVASERQVRTLKEKGVDGLVFSPDGNTLAAFNGSAILWNLGNGQKRGIPTDGKVIAAAFSADGKSLATELTHYQYGQAVGNSIKVWNTITGELIRRARSDDDLFSTFAGLYIKSTDKPATFDGRIQFVREENGGIAAKERIAVKERISGKVLANLFVFGDKGWVVNTPEGLFDASPAGKNFIHYSDITDDILSPDEVEDGNFVPGLLQKILKYEQLPAAQAPSDKPPPKRLPTPTPALKPDN